MTTPKPKAGHNPANPTTALRAALHGPFPALAEAAAELVVDAIHTYPSHGQRAASLGLTRRSYERLRDEFPELWETTEP